MLPILWTLFILLLRPLLFHLPLMARLHRLHFFIILLVSISSFALHSLPNRCNESCGSMEIPLPFHINASCGLPFEAVRNPFHLSCIDSSVLSITIGNHKLRIVDILSDGIVVDPGIETGHCHKYIHVSSFSLELTPFFAVSGQNLLCLYGCGDSSVCKVDCDAFSFNGCGGFERNESFRCCYSLTDHSMGDLGECRGFSSWVVAAGTSSATPGLKLEWALPRDYAEVVCAENARLVNSSAVEDAVRCACENGLVGDGFAQGLGCVKPCIQDDGMAYGSDCQAGSHRKREAIVLAGVLASAFAVSAILTPCLLLLHKRHIEQNRGESHGLQYSTITEFVKACRIRLFTYEELVEATRGFSTETHNLIRGRDYAGVLQDGSPVAVEEMECESDHELLRVLNKIELLHEISHKNIALLIGCCVSSHYMPRLVYEPTPNGTLHDHLRQERGKCLDWHQRLNIAIETASLLTYLQVNVSPPIHHHDLSSTDIFLDHDYSVKLAGVWRTGPRLGRSQVQNLGLILLEIITGSDHVNLPSVALPMIAAGKVGEIVDPSICFSEQPYRREQVESVANVSCRCLLSGEEGRITILDVARELSLIGEATADNKKKGAALEETFSTSSLLQMISRSPDSIYAPCAGMEEP